MSGQTKQAKVLTPNQVERFIKFLRTETSFPERNVVIGLLSFRAGLRSKEIAGLTWSMVTDAEGKLADEMTLENTASKGKRGGRVIPLHPELRDALRSLRALEQERTETNPERGCLGCYVITLQKSASTLASRARSVAALMNGKSNEKLGWFRELGWEGVTSHSGRRTFITNAARNVVAAGGSLRDVQSLSGHSNLENVQRYIDVNVEAKRKVVFSLYDKK